MNGAAGALLVLRPPPPNLGRPSPPGAEPSPTPDTRVRHRFAARRDGHGAPHPHSRRRDQQRHVDRLSKWHRLARRGSNVRTELGRHELDRQPPPFCCGVNKRPGAPRVELGPAVRRGFAARGEAARLLVVAVLARGFGVVDARRSAGRDVRRLSCAAAGADGSVSAFR